MVTKSSSKSAACGKQTTVKLGRLNVLPALVTIAVYFTTASVAITIGLNWSPVIAGLQFTVAPVDTLLVISMVTSFSGLLQSVTIKYPVALEPHKVPSYVAK